MSLSSQYQEPIQQYNEVALHGLEHFFCWRETISGSVLLPAIVAQMLLSAI